MTEPEQDQQQTVEQTPVSEALTGESLVEEVSIDGMCGVY